MKISSPSCSFSDYDIADWLELSAFFEGKISFVELKVISEANEDSESGNIAIDDSDTESFCTRIEDIILHRSNIIKENYPFIIDKTILTVSDYLDEPKISYLLCLLLSHMRTNQLLEEDKDKLTNKIRDYMQVVATACAAGDVNGHACSFGFPRPDHSSMHAKIKVIYDKYIGKCTIKKNIPSFVEAAKDGGIDVIAWSFHNDGHLNNYLLGQVATGDNWDTKSVVLYVDQFHDTWFDAHPVLKPKQAMFVPFIVGKDCKETERNDFRRSKELLVGHIFDREKIPSYISHAKELIQQHNTHIERFNEYSNIDAWLKQVQTEHN